jgi:hypothetical protein
MPEGFDPYHRWLGIQPEEQPANHYRLLGLVPFEEDPEVIRDAADQRMAHVRTYSLGPTAEMSQEILNELGAAKACLLSAEDKAEYDCRLRARIAKTAEQPQPVVAGDALKPDPVAKQPPSARSSNRSRQTAAVVGVCALICAALVGYWMSTKPSEGPQGDTQANADASANQPQQDSSASAGLESPAQPDPPATPPPATEPPEPQPPATTSPEPKASVPEPKPKQGSPRPEAKPVPVADPPEKVGERVKDALAKAKSPADFRAVAADAIALVERIGNSDKGIAKAFAALALFAASKANDYDLIRKATLQCVELGENQ